MHNPLYSIVMYTKYTDSRQKIVDTSTSPSCLSQYYLPIWTFCAEENRCRIQHTCITSYIHVCTHTCRQTNHWPSVPYPRIVYIHIPPSFYTYVSTLYPRSLDLESSFFSSFDPNSQISYFRYGTSLPLQSIGSHHAREGLECFFLLLFLMRMEFSNPLNWAEPSWRGLACAFVHFTWITCRSPGTRRTECFVCLTTILLSSQGWMGISISLLSCLVLVCFEFNVSMHVSKLLYSNKEERKKQAPLPLPNQTLQTPSILVNYPVMLTKVHMFQHKKRKKKRIIPRPIPE